MEYAPGDVDEHGRILCTDVGGDTFEHSYWVDRGEVFVTREQAQQAMRYGWTVVESVFGLSPDDVVRIRRA